MVDKQLDELDELISWAPDDLVYVVHDPAGTPVDGKVKMSTLLAADASIDNPALFGSILAGGTPYYDEEFNRADVDDVPGGWFWAGTQGDATYHEQWGAGIMTVPGSDYTGRYLMRNLPSGGGYEVVAKLSGGLPDANYTGYGLVIYGNISEGGGVNSSVQFANTNDGGLRVRRYYADRLDSTGNYASTGKQPFGPVLYLSMTNHGFNLWSFKYSHDGLIWSTVAASVDLSSHLGAPNSVGLVLYGSAGPTSLACHWFRVRPVT